MKKVSGKTTSCMPKIKEHMGNGQRPTTAMLISGKRGKKGRK